MMPITLLDGILVMEDGSFLISSWEGKAVYRGPATGPFQPVIENVVCFIRFLLGRIAGQTYQQQIR